VAKYGVPDEVLFDNGADYTSKRLSGGRKLMRLTPDERAELLKAQGLALPILEQVHVRVNLANAYRGQSKPVERDFGIIEADFNKHLPGYTGRNTSEKPESLKPAIKRGALLSFEQFAEAFGSYLELEFHRKPCHGKALAGRSRAQAWQDEFAGNRMLAADDLDLLRRERTKPQAVRRGAITVDGIRWTGDWMARFESTPEGRAEKFVLYLPLDREHGTAIARHASDNTWAGECLPHQYRVPAFARDDEGKALLRRVTSRIQAKKKTLIETARSRRRISPENIIASYGSTLPAPELGRPHQVDEAIVGCRPAAMVCDTRTGEMIIDAAEIITPAHVAVLLSAGIISIRVLPQSNTIVLPKSDEARERRLEAVMTGTYNQELTLPPPVIKEDLSDVSAFSIEPIN
jgi:hypothetical protein